MGSGAAPGVRLAELVAILSFGADLGLGQPMEHVLRQSLIALRLAEDLGLDGSERAALYYASLLSWVGCHVDAYEQARWFGDDLALKADFRRVDGAGGAFMLRHLAAGRPWAERARVGMAFLPEGRRAAESMLENHWHAADELAAQLGLGRQVRDCLAQTFERWDGKGTPGKAGGQDISIVSRLVSLADVVEVYHRAGGVEAAVSVAVERKGTQFDPAIVDLFCEEAAELFDALGSVSTWDEVIAASPELVVVLSDEETDRALLAVANFTDLKSPFTLGHSAGVTELAAAGARTWGLPPSDVTDVRRAAMLHDLGRLGVSNAVWDKRGGLTAIELERVRLHPYLTERMLASSSALAPLGAIAVQHHERLDGSGYPRGLPADALGPAGRILAVADTYHAKTEPRPHRSALSPAEAAAHLRAEVRTGRLDGDAVECVLRAGGHRARRRRGWPDGLTTREVEVLRLLALGHSAREIAAQLVISRKTASHHVEHIYTKIGVSNRASASLYAAQHGLIADPLSDAP
jgi:HD-GYP domain-containing protein (c-di-GMP phosphodiesterase class II)